MEGKTMISLLGMPVTAYALCIVISVSVGLAVLAYLVKKRGLKPGTVSWFALLALPIGLVGARLFYCLARLSFFLEIGPENMLYLWNGGYMLWGAAAGCLAAAAITARITRQNLLDLLDALAAPAALVIALCRFSEYFSGEGIGPFVENEAFCHFPLAVCNEWEEWYWAVFMLEGTAALIIAALVWKKSDRGGQTKKFLLFYSACQVFLEALRRDNFPRWLFVRVSQLIAVLVIAGMMLYALIQWKKSTKKSFSAKKMGICWVGYLLCIALIIILEFAVDKSADLPVWLCYCLEAVFCAGLLGTSYPIVMKAQ